jgi:hypothetical protein
MNPEAATTGQTETLADALATHAPLHLAEILQVGSGIARCLARLHAAGQLHLDLCPAKVLWSRSGGQGAVQLDVQLGPPQERRADNHLLGSIDPGFTSPELLQNGTVDARSDLFSLGCVLYAMSTGHGPFWGATPADLARSVRDTEPRPVSQLNPRLTAWLAAVIMKLLEKDPSRRFDDAAQLSDMLRLQASMAGTIRRPPPRSVPDRPAAVRVPINAVLAAAASEPAASSSNGNGRHEPAKTVDPAALAAEMATLAETMTAAPTTATYWRRALLAGLCAVPVLIGLALLAGWWMQPAASGEGAKPDKTWQEFFSLGGNGSPKEKRQRSATHSTAVTAEPKTGDRSPATDTEPVSDGPVAFTKTKALGNDRNGEEFEELSESLGPVIGFEVTTFDYSGHPAIKSIQTIYRSGETTRLGATFGAPHGQVTRIEARPGYAVGGLTVRAGSRVDGFKVRFMRQTGRKLNANDAYDSDWVGGSGGKGGKPLGGNGRLVIGIHGRSSRDLDAIGLMQTVEQPSDDSQ